MGVPALHGGKKYLLLDAVTRAGYTYGEAMGLEPTASEETLGSDIVNANHLNVNNPRAQINADGR